MGKFISKVMKQVVGLDKIVGVDKLTSGVLDNFLGTDLLGTKAAQADAQERERQLNEQALNSQMVAQQNANMLGVQGTDNVAQVVAGGSAADAALLNDTKKKRTNSISSALGI